MLAVTPEDKRILFADTQALSENVSRPTRSTAFSDAIPSVQPVIKLGALHIPYEEEMLKDNAQPIARLCGNSKRISKLGREQKKTAENIGRRPDYWLIISPMWEIIYPIRIITDFSHSLSLEPTPLTTQFADYGS